MPSVEKPSKIQALVPGIALAGACLGGALYAAYVFSAVRLDVPEWSVCFWAGHFGLAASLSWGFQSMRRGRPWAGMLLLCLAVFTVAAVAGTVLYGLALCGLLSAPVPDLVLT